VTPDPDRPSSPGGPHARGAGYLERVERYAGRTFTRREEIGRLLAAAGGPGNDALLDELLFLSKFCDRAIGIIRRTGPGSDDVAALTTELARATERIATLLEALLGTADGTGRPPLDQASFSDLRDLIGELAVLKNFELHEAGK